MQDFKKLGVWQKSHSLTLRTYSITATFPKAELFGLTCQMRRAAVSIPANIAEGCCRGGNRMLAQHLRVALGSAGELEYYVALASDLKRLQKADGTELVTNTIEVKLMLGGLLRVVGQETED